MRKDALLSMLSLEIGQLRGRLLGSHYLLSPETIATAEQSIQHLTALLESMRANPAAVQHQQIKDAITHAEQQRNILRTHAESVLKARGKPDIEPLTVSLVDHRAPPGCLVSVMTFAIGVLTTIHLPFIGWVVGPFIIIGILFHKGTPTYYCSNCTTELTYKTAKICPGCGAEFTGVERRGSGNKYGVWILILVGVFYLFGAVL